ncbi:hypothetical protein [Agrobacterium sp. SORGH_AS 787]|uniref:hypothetical protein n=1 Tax=Agrobacterium sp. SORGH_AS 787 TaxID=3041775 RepID=UPI00277EA93C|nr:hypothetical protein [Rhizobium sp. SORGH_AS_0787]
MEDKNARQTIEETDEKTTRNEDIPAAGPHAKKHLTDDSKTPGAGSLPDEDDNDINPGSG